MSCRLHLSLRWSAVVLFCSVTLVSPQTPSYPAKLEWSVVPPVVRQSQGKYPGSATAVLYWNPCERDPKGKITNPLPPKDSYTISISGVGVTASAPTVGECTLTTTLTIDGSAQPGAQLLVVRESPSSVGNGSGLLAMMDATAGPTPGSPEVDVLWEVMSKQVCSDDFGNRVPNELYCIEVKIGNNSGHSIQLSGIGFRRKHPLAGKGTVPTNETLASPNTSYQTARAVAQAGQSQTLRNQLYHSVQALGLVMASFTPFFHNTHSSFRWSTGAAIVSGALVHAIDTVAPDLTLKELNNLDDQSFRDGKLIPNNTQVRMIVFVDKEDVTGSIDAACDTLYAGKDVDIKNCQKKPNPSVIRVALGDMVLVGDQVDYIQRMVVDTGVTSQEVAPAPIVTSASLSTTSGGSIEGANLATVQSVYLDDKPVEIKKDTQSATHLDFTIPADAQKDLVAKPHTVKVMSASGQSTTIQGVAGKQ